MPKATGKGPTEADIIFNRANVALARSQRLIQSWLPARTAEEMATTKTEEELRKEDEELFKPAPELLGVGAIAPENEQDAIIKRRGASNQRLLEQLLGKKAAKGHMASKAPTRSAQSTAQDSRQSIPAPVDSDDEEEGRASMVASKGARKGQPSRAFKVPKSTTSELIKLPQDGHDKQAEEEEASQETQPQSKPQVRASLSDEDEPKPSKKRAMSYLDQLLAEKASKKKKKKQKGAA